MDLRAHLQDTLGSIYRIDQELGNGGMSRVFLALDEHFSRPVVIKVLPPELAVAVSSERFKREIQIAAKLQHPNIVPLITAGQSGDLLYYVMPLAGESTLRSLIQRHRELPLRDVVRYTADVASALTYAHSHNIIHRDIKPENILIEGRRALLADFGIARAIERAANVDGVTDTGLAVGTPLYMSPEQAAGDPSIDERSDIYSLACVVVEMLTGAPPFTATTARRLAAMHLHERPPSVVTVRPDLPAAIDEVLSTALAKSPAGRFKTADEFADALSNCVSRRSDPMIPPPTLQPAGGKRWPAIALAGVAVVAAAALMVSPRFRGSRAAGSAQRDPSRIAVLTFTSPEATGELATTASGFTRDLIASLQAIPSLTVISPEGVAGLTGARPDSIGRALNVGTIIAGTLERVGDTLEANVRLIDPTSAEQRGSARIRRPATAFVRMRDSVVGAVAAQLRQRLGQEIRLRDWRSQTRSDSAWSLRQRGEALLDYEAAMRRNPVDLTPQLNILRQADSLLEAATRADPNWPAPDVARARIRVRLADYFEGARSLSQVDTGLAMMRAAIRKRPDDPEALAMRGQLRYLRVFYGGGGSDATARAILDSARMDLITATASDAHFAEAWSTLSTVDRLYGDMPGSVRAARRALAVDAYLRSVPGATTRLIYALLYSGDAAAARALCLQTVASYPDDIGIGTCELGVLGYSGTGSADVSRVWELTAENERAGPWVLVRGVSPIARYWTAAVIARTGLKDSARAVIDRTRREVVAAGVADDYWIVEAYARMVVGDTTATVRVLSRAIETGRATPFLIGSLPQFAPMRDAPAFRALTQNR